MAYEPNEGWGTLWKVQEQTDKGPLYTGDCKVDGKVWRMAVWVKETKHGRKYLNVKFSEPDRDAGERDSRASKQADDIPF